MKLKGLAIGPKNEVVTGQSKSFSSYITNSGIDWCVLNNGPYSKNLFEIFIFIFNLIRFRLFFDYNIIYFTCSRSLFGFIKDFITLSILTFRKKDLFVVNHLHGADFESFYDNSSKFIKSLIQNLYTRINISIVITEKMINQFKDLPFMRVSVVNNFFDPVFLISDHAFDERVEKFFEDEIKIIFLSNIIEEKGLHILLDAVDEIRLKVEKNITVKIAGKFLCSDDYEEEVLARINNCSHFSYHGTCSPDQIKRLFADSDIFALPSYYPTEAAPLSILEAQAGGCLVLATTQGYISEIVPPKYKFLAKPNDTTSFTNVLLGAIKDREQAIKELARSRDFIMSNCTLAEHVRRIDDIVFRGF